MRRYSRLPREEAQGDCRRGRWPAASAARSVVAELALAIVLLTGAGLLIRSWQQVAGVDPGFRPQRILSLQLSTTAFAGPNQRADFYQRVLDELRSLRGVESAGIVSDLFVSSDAERSITLDGSPARSRSACGCAPTRPARAFSGTVGTRLAPGPLLLRHRSAWRTSSRHRQRGHGTAVVARPGSADGASSSARRVPTRPGSRWSA